MSKREDFINDAKAFVKDALKKHFKKETFGEAMLEDGETQVTYEEDAIAVGVVVSIMDSQGNKMPLPEGNYKLEDGTTFDIVDEMGTADNVVMAEPTAEVVDTEDTGEMEQENITPQAKSVVETITKETHFEEMKELEELKKSFAAQTKELELVKAENESLKSAVADESREKQEFSSVIDDLKSKVEKQDGLTKQLFEMVEKIGEQPSATPTDSKKKPFTKLNIAEQRKAFRADLDR